MELNGVSSEAAHVYDPDYKIVRAYKDIARHMKIIYRIAKKNHDLGVKYAPPGQFLNELRQYLIR